MIFRLYLTISLFLMIAISCEEPNYMNDVMPSVPALTPSSNQTTASSNPLELMVFATIPSGSFYMGVEEDDTTRFDWEKPRHLVHVQEFQMLTTEVTQEMWQSLMGDNPASGYGVDPEMPVYRVSWNDCQRFITSLNQLDSIYSYRLPSEAEWEYACRAGTETLYYWGDSDSEEDVKRHCWYEMNCETRNWSAPHADQEGVQRVGTLEPNAWGLYDMSGNVYEWCEDNWHSGYSFTGLPVDGTAWVHDGGENRVFRGGSWDYPASRCTSTDRLYDNQAYDGASYIGFRIVRVERNE